MGLRKKCEKMNMAIDIINYMRVKEGKEDLSGKNIKLA